MAVFFAGNKVLLRAALKLLICRDFVIASEAPVSESPASSMAFAHQKLKSLKPNLGQSYHFILLPLVFFALNLIHSLILART